MNPWQYGGSDTEPDSRISWGSGGHSAGYVPLFVLGVGAENFNGKLDNTDIPRQIEALDETVTGRIGRYFVWLS